MRNINRTSTTPLNHPRTNRNHDLVVLTSLPAGKMVPLAAVPLLREDGVKNGAFRVAFEMHETVEILMNPVLVKVSAYLIPHLALERFEGSMDQFDRSYSGQPKVDGGAVVPFIETHAAGTHGSNAVYKALGLHAKPTDQVNTAYLEAYNVLWNFLAKNRSPDITPRTRLDSTLAPAFWPHSRFEHIVPDFDQAVIDGEVALNVVNQRLPVSGFGRGTHYTNSQSVTAVDSANPAGVNYPAYVSNQNSGQFLYMRTNSSGKPDVFAELAQNGITVSLSNIELAKQTQAFAKLRQQYNGHDDDYIIDMLMNGLTIQDQHLKQPILIAQETTKFGMAKRYSTEATALTESVVSGMAEVSMRLRLPKVHTGGVILIVAQVVPEQLFERQRDPFFHTTHVDKLPEALRDRLDPEKVDLVPNGYIDTDHTAPNATFGYQPLNAQWNSFGPRVGGKFYRPSVNTGFDDARQRLWAVETVDPVLSENFYIVKGLHLKPFVDQTTDPFDAVMIGNLVINGNTVFGGQLVEATNDYDEVMAEAPQDRITKTP